MQKLTITHYRGFCSEQDLNFAIPDGKKEGSGLTLIVGPNNTGKTSVQEALLLLKANDKNRFDESSRHEQDPEITIRFGNTQNDGVYNEMSLTNLDGGSRITRSFHRVSVGENGKEHSEDAGKCEIPEVNSIVSRRHWSSSGSIDWGNQPDIFNFQSLLTESSKPRSNENDALYMMQRLGAIQENKKDKEYLSRMLRRLIPNFTDWYIDTYKSQDYIKYKTADGKTHGVDLLGDGTLSLFFICSYLMEDNANKNTFLVIDEPELSLHPIAQVKLSKIISEMSVKRQIVVCTHSPYFVNWQDWQNGASFIRLNKHEDKECKTGSLNRDATYKKLLQDNKYWRLPFLMDTVAKEILFANKVLFVEGQEDVGLIRRWLSGKGLSVDFNIFGYGVGGYGNIAHMLHMAEDLRLKEVAALYDSDIGATEALEHNKERFKDYGFFQLPTKDIRDKEGCIKCVEGCGCPKIKGCFNKEGELHSDDDGRKFEEVMDKIINYFKSD